MIRKKETHLTFPAQSSKKFITFELGFLIRNNSGHLEDKPWPWLLIESHSIKRKDPQTPSSPNMITHWVHHYFNINNIVFTCLEKLLPLKEALAPPPIPFLGSNLLILCNHLLFTKFAWQNTIIIERNKCSVYFVKESFGITEELLTTDLWHKLPTALWNVSMKTKAWRSHSVQVISQLPRPRNAPCPPPRTTTVVLNQSSFPPFMVK